MAAPKGGAPSGVKNASLAVLVVQNTLLVLLMRYTRTTTGDMYVASTAVASMEIVKLAVCSAVVFLESGGQAAFARRLRLEVVDKPLELAKLAVPALLYTVQNNLLYTALSCLDAATYSVCYQLKILTTALFSVVLLGKRLTSVKWLSLLLLTVGVALAESSSHSMPKDGSVADATASSQVQMLGFACVIAAACTSGFAGVYFEMILKGARTSLWIRNIQMGIPSMTLALASVWAKDGAVVRAQGFFHGYTFLVVCVVLLQAVGGLVVAVVVRYADNIRKSFAAAVSIILSCGLSVCLFDFQPDLHFAAGALCVSVSVYLYSRPGREKALPHTHALVLGGAPQRVWRSRHRV